MNLRIYWKKYEMTFEKTYPNGKFTWWPSKSSSGIRLLAHYKWCSLLLPKLTANSFHSPKPFIIHKINSFFLILRLIKYLSILSNKRFKSEMRKEVSPKNPYHQNFGKISAVGWAGDTLLSMRHEVGDRKNLWLQR